MDIREVADIVDSEGLGYAIVDYMNGDEIEDQELRDLWKQASPILARIQEIISPYYQ